MQPKLENMARTVSHLLPESSNSIMLAHLLLILEDLGSNVRTYLWQLALAGIRTHDTSGGRKRNEAHRTESRRVRAGSECARPSHRTKLCTWPFQKKTLLLNSLGWITLVIDWNIQQRWGRTLASQPSFWGSIPSAYHRWFLIDRATKTWNYGTTVSYTHLTLPTIA